MSRRPTIKGKSMSQDLATRMQVNPQARDTFVGRAEYKRKPKAPQAAPKGIGKY